MNNRQLLSLIISTFLLLGCDNSTNLPYIISKEDSLKKLKYTREDGVVIMPPKVFQGNYNFIIDSNNKCYFYSFTQKTSNKFFVDDELPSPEEWLKNLTPEKLLSIPKGKEIEFFETNVLEKSEPGYAVQIASEKDTITNDLLTYLLKLNSRPNNNNMFLNIRHILKVEKTILNKKSDKPTTVEN